MTRLSILAIVAWWKRRQALRQAPSPAEIARLKARVALKAKHHRERASHIKALRDAVNRRLAAELGVRNPTRRTS